MTSSCSFHGSVLTVITMTNCGPQMLWETCCLKRRVSFVGMRIKAGKVWVAPWLRCKGHLHFQWCLVVISTHLNTWWLAPQLVSCRPWWSVPSDQKVTIWGTRLDSSSIAEKVWRWSKTPVRWNCFEQGQKLWTNRLQQRDHGMISDTTVLSLWPQKPPVL